MVPRMSHAFGSIDEMGDGVFRKVRQELGVTAFGVNALVLAPGVVGRPHYRAKGGYMGRDGHLADPEAL